MMILYLNYILYPREALCQPAHAYAGFRVTIHDMVRSNYKKHISFFAPLWKNPLLGERIDFPLIFTMFGREGTFTQTCNEEEKNTSIQG